MGSPQQPQPLAQLFVTRLTLPQHMPQQPHDFSNGIMTTASSEQHLTVWQQTRVPPCNNSSLGSFFWQPQHVVWCFHGWRSKYSTRMLSTSHFPHMPTQQTFWYAGNERGGREKKQRVANVFDVNIICRGGEQDAWTISYQHSFQLNFPEQTDTNVQRRIYGRFPNANNIFAYKEDLWFRHCRRYAWLLRFAIWSPRP